VDVVHTSSLLPPCMAPRGINNRGHKEYTSTIVDRWREVK